MGVFAGAWLDVLVDQVLFPVNGRGAAEIVEVVELAIPARRHAIGDGVLAVKPALGAARHGRLLREGVAGVAEVAAFVADPGAVVLPGRAALKGDAHGNVVIGRIHFIAHDARPRLAEQVRQGDAVGRQTGDALVPMRGVHLGLINLAPLLGLLVAQILHQGGGVFHARLAERLVGQIEAGRTDGFAVDVAEELILQRPRQRRIGGRAGLVGVGAGRVVGEDIKGSFCLL
jgi:hypothetical protein